MKLLVVLVFALGLLLTMPGGAAAATGYKTIYYDHSGTACATSTPTGKPPFSVTGLAFNGTDLMLSCWGDNTITMVNPHTGAQDGGGGFGVYHVFTSTGAPLQGIGGLAWDAQDGVLWACNLSAYTGTAKNKATDVGYITLDSGDGTGTFTHVFNTPKVASPNYGGCDNGVAYDQHAAALSPGYGPIWTASVSRILYNWTAQGSMVTSVPIAPLEIGTNAGGMAFSQSFMYIADPSTTTKHVYQLNRNELGDGAGTKTLLSGTHRFEDLECDASTFAPQIVIWTEWFNQNAVKPIPVSDTSC